MLSSYAGMVAAIVAGVIGVAGPPVTVGLTGVPVDAATIPTNCRHSYTDVVAVGSPGRDLVDVPDAGAVVLKSAYSRDQLDPGIVLTSSDLGRAAAPHDRFGASSAWVNLTVGDRVHEPLYVEPARCPDLVIGVPGADEGRGAIVIIPDFGNGLEPSHAVWLGPSSTALQPGDGLGTALAVAEVYTANGTDRVLVAGAPGRDLPGAPNAGAVLTWAFPWQAGDLNTPPALPGPAAEGFMVQGSDGILGNAEPQDRFGSVLSSGNPLTVGIPNEDIGRKSNAGAVATLTFAEGRVVANELLWLGHGLPGKPRAGDRLGAAVFGEMAIGAPGRDSNGRRDSGAVLIKWRWSENRDPHWRIFTQNTRGVPDKSERGDGFGTAVAWLARAQEESAIAIGTPGEDYRHKKNAGAVTYVVLFSERTDVEGRWAFARQALPRLAKGDRFGATFVRVPGDPAMDWDTTDSLLVGAPGEDVPGARNVGRFWGVLGTSKLVITGTTSLERMGG